MAKFRVMADELSIRGGDDVGARFSKHYGDTVDEATLTRAGLHVEFLLAAGTIEPIAGGLSEATVTGGGKPAEPK